MRHKKLYFLTFITAFAILLLLLKNADAQFGTNKVQYKNFKWDYIQTKHFDIYFNQGGNYIAEFTASVAESSLVSISKSIDYNINNRIPLIIFNSHNEFQQNNVIEDYLPEGIGGVTELFKNRIVIPFEGKYEQFRHVIHHELVHAFMNDMYYGGSIQNIIAKNISLDIPQWLSEGMAEYQSLNGLDKATDMFIRDAVINNYLPPIEYNQGYLSYRGGQSFLSFLADYYGEEKIGLFMNAIKTRGNVDDAIEEVYKLKLEKVSEKWHKELKKTYWPEIKTRLEVTDFAKGLTDHAKDGGFYNISPVISPKGDKFAFISNRDDFFDVFIADVRTGRIIDKVIKGNTTSNFEELQVLTPGLTWAPDGRKLAISVKAGSKDAIFIIDVNSGDEQKLPVTLNSISYASWSPIGNKIAFIGTNTRQSDIYIYDLKTGILSNLTNDIFSDYCPSWSPDGVYVYFSSDRDDYINPKSISPDFRMSDIKEFKSDIYKINITNGEITRVTKIKNGSQTYPQFSNDSRKMLYLSDVNGITNIYLRETDTTGKETDRPITNSLNPIDQISLSLDGKKLLFVSLNNGGYDIFSLDNPFNMNPGLKILEPTVFVKNRSDRLLLSERTDKIDSLGLSIDIDTIHGSRIRRNINDIVNDNKFKNDTTGLYGKEIDIDFKRIKSDSVIKRQEARRDSLYKRNKNFSISDNKNSDGSFKIKNYKIKFSPDLVYGNATYSSFYGVQGVAQIMLSDMLGDHKIYLLTSMVIDLKNSDYAAAYYYLPKRIDYGFELFHTARFILYDKGFGDQLYRYRSYGGNVNLSYPITKFKRLEGGISALRVSQENLDNSLEPVSAKSLLVPSLSFVHDNSLFGYTTPIKGTRYKFSLLNSPKLGSEGLEFTSILGDFRTYFKIADDYSFAVRFSGGASFGLNPQRFYLGGVDNWINHEFENYNIPISNIEEYAFSVPGLPLRGYNYDRISGSKYLLTNLELRFPLFKYLILGALPIGFQNIQGLIFIDAGTAWRNNKDLKLFYRDNNNIFKTRDLLLGTGMGVRIILFGLPFRYDVAWGFNLNKFSRPKHYISLGLDF